MAIQYSGAVSSSIFTCTTGTRQEIVTGLQNTLTAAGWTIISGGGTDNVLMQSSTTPVPQSLACRVQVQDPGSGDCAQIRWSNIAGTKVQANQFYLLPAVGKVYQVIANPYQFFCFSDDSASANRTFIAGGVPYIPSFLQGVIIECIWAQGNCYGSDTATNFPVSFRTVNWTGSYTSQCQQWCLTNGNMWELVNNQYENFVGCQALLIQIGSNLVAAANDGLIPSYRWHDGSLLTYEPLITWGLTSCGDEGMIRGQLWDAAMISGPFVADQTTIFDTHNWWVFTNNSILSSGYSKLVLAIT